VITTTSLSRERILVYGGPAMGKSTALLQIAREVIAAGNTVYAIDNDNAFERLLETEFTDVKIVGLWDHDQWAIEGDGPGLVLFKTKGWDEAVTGVTMALETASRDDWVMLDTATALWSGVQKWFIEQAYGKSMDEFLLTFRQENATAMDAAKKKGKTVKLKTAGEAQFADWVIVNSTYFAVMEDLLIHARCHVAATAEGQTLGDKEDKETRDIFGPLNLKPKGQKSLGHNPQTVVMLTKDRQGRYMTTAKDRGREELVKSPWSDFAEDYLVGVGGWAQIILNKTPKPKAKN